MTPTIATRLILAAGGPRRRTACAVLLTALGLAAPVSMAQDCAGEVRAALAGTRVPATLGELCTAAGANYAPGLTVTPDLPPATGDDLLRLAVDLDTRARAPLDAAALPAILARTAIEAEQEQGWLAQIIRWLRARYGDEQLVAGLEQLAALLERIAPPAWIVEALMRCIVVVIVVAAAAVLLRGLAPWRKRQRRQRGRAPVQRPARPAVADPAPGIDDIARATPATQPRLILRWLRAELVRRALVPADDALTHGEQWQYCRERDASAAAGFAELLRQLEPLVYGRAVANEGELHELLTRTRRFLAGITV